jgi:autoinducer 2 (AI-2) kinase
VTRGDLTLAIDAGTGSCRAVIFDADGVQLGHGQREWTHRPEPGVPGSQAFDTAANWPLVASCVREALSTSGVPAARVAAVAAASMREGMVLWGADDRELWACPNVDSRAAAEAEALVASGDAERIYRTGGDWVAITSPARFRWLATHRPDVLDATRHVGMLSDWIATRLCGAYATDPSIGSSSGLFDLAGRTWSTELLELVGIDPSIVPPVVEGGTPIGQVGRAAAAETGLLEGTMVVAGGADTQLGLLGIGRIEPGVATVVGGTFWQATCVLDRPLIDPATRLRTLCHAVPDRWMIEGIGFWSGLAMRWFRDAFCDTERAQAQREGVDPYVVMERAAAGVGPGANGVVGVFSNLMEARRWVHAAPSFMGFDIAAPERSGRPECVRALEESAAFVGRGHLEIVAEVAGTVFDEVVFTGGAAKGELWPQILADVLGKPVHVPVEKESTALGAALLARVGAGLDSDLPSALDRVVRRERTFQPETVDAARYDELYASWREIYTRALDLSEAGLVRPMWRAAGA